MIQLARNRLEFRFPSVHPLAELKIDFQRTLRIPDDGKDYPLPAGMGSLPIRNIDEFDQNTPREWQAKGGAIIPMYQSEATWLGFNCGRVPAKKNLYPFAIMVAAGNINAVSGEKFDGVLSSSPQNYMSAPKQPWLDGYNVAKGIIRQFVAMPLGEGFSAEEQLTGQTGDGGLRIMVFPMKRDVFEERFPDEIFDDLPPDVDLPMSAKPKEMGLAAGGRMKQKIYQDPFDIDDWDTTVAARCFVRIINSISWLDLSGKKPPASPCTALEYESRGIPWFEYYDADGVALEGVESLSGLKGITEVTQNHGQPGDEFQESIEPERVIKLHSVDGNIIRQYDE